MIARTLMEPRRIASYTLLESIGYGGMAVVYRARQDSLDRTVAIKVLSESLAASPEFKQRFKREAQTAANLRHPNVITVYDFGEDERGVPYLVLEYVEGPTLADLMDVGLDDERVADLLDQIAAGLDYAHARGVVHRDVKPGNVLTTADGRVVLADFGLAWLIEGAQLTLTGGMIGTPEYMSPEQAAGLPFDQRADVYALGVVLYEMLVGDRPFVAETPFGILLQRLQEPAPSVLLARPELPEAVGDVLDTALLRDPASRYDSAGALARAFRAAFAQPHRPSPAGASALSAGDTARAFDVLDTHAQGVRDVATPSRTPDAREVTTVAVVEPAAAEAAVEPAAAEAAVERLACPECQRLMPVGAGICPACGHMIPLDSLPRSYSASYASPPLERPSSPLERPV
jgi:eukaryotic-like serine/threonine-protein kinase